MRCVPILTSLPLVFCTPGTFLSMNRYSHQPSIVEEMLYWHLLGYSRGNGSSLAGEMVIKLTAAIAFDPRRVVNGVIAGDERGLKASYVG